MSKDKDIRDHEPRHRQTYARLYDVMHPESIDELAKVIRDRYPQVITATHQRRCHWKDDGICLDAKCDAKQCDDAQDVIILGLKKPS